MTDNPVAEQPPSGPADLQVLEAHIEAAWVSLGRPGDDLVEIITYSDGKFTSGAGPGRPGVPVPHFLRVLEPEELAALLHTLLHRPNDPPAGSSLDHLALQAFVGVLAEKVEPGHRDQQGHQ
jgi:hypothetical protein